MKKPHILFVTEKYTDGNPAWLSNSHHNLFGSLECSGLADYSNFFFEENPHYVDDNLIKYHRRLQPSLTVVTILINPTFKSNPTNKAFAEISKRSPVVFIWFDTVCKYVMDLADSFAQYASLNVILDNPFFIPKEKYLNLWTPQDTRLYNDPGLERDIDVSFIGSMHGYGDRASYLNHLMCNSGAKIYRDGGQREGNLSPEEYVKQIQKSKISLNFSKNRQGSQQTKGRVWEVTLCGAMLMEDVNQGTSLWFDPFKDYVPFTSPEDLVDKTNYYLNHPDKMAEIAANGKMKSNLHYSPKNWWLNIFNRCGIQTSTI